MSAEQKDATRSWRSLLEIATPLLGLGGLYVYSLSVFSYRNFYGALGVSSKDVGLGYIDILSNSVGVILVTAIPMIAGAAAYEFLFALIASVAAARNVFYTRTAFIRSIRRSRLFIVSALIYFSALTFTVGAPSSAYADAVKEGRPVLPAKIGPVDTFMVQAYPVTLQPVDKDKSTSLGNVGRPLLYLGQSGGAIVVYDSVGQVSQMVPASSVVVSVVNCNASNAPENHCAHLFRARGIPSWTWISAGLLFLLGSVSRLMLIFWGNRHVTVMPIPEEHTRKP